MADSEGETYRQIHAFLMQGNYLDQQEQTKHLARGFLQQSWQMGRYPQVTSFSEEAGNVFFSVLQAVLDANIETIYQFAQSPIERKFLCCVLLDSLFVAPWSVNVTGPIDITTYPDFYRSQYQEIESAYEEMSQKSGFSLEAYMEFLQTSPSLSEDQRKRMMYYVLFERTLDHYTNFHISLQPTIRLEERSLRPDFFIWVPSQPDFKLIIECDGFAYHSDKEAFSRDRSRDRLLQQHNYRVFRFSGHEIYHDCVRKAHEFCEYLFSLQAVFLPSSPPPKKTTLSGKKQFQKKHPKKRRRNS